MNDANNLISLFISFSSFSLIKVNKESNSSEVNKFSSYILFESCIKSTEDILFIWRLNSRHNLNI